MPYLIQYLVFFIAIAYISFVGGLILFFGRKLIIESLQHDNIMIYLKESINALAWLCGSGIITAFLYYFIWDINYLKPFFFNNSYLFSISMFFLMTISMFLGNILNYEEKFG